MPTLTSVLIPTSLAEVANHIMSSFYI